LPANAYKCADPRCIPREGETLPPRPKSSPEEILALTFELIAEHDVSGVTVDMIATRSGVSKATIYRRWPSREMLIQATIDNMRRPSNDPVSGSLRGDLTILLNELVAFLNRPVGGKVFAAFLNAAVRNPGLAVLNREMTRDVRSVYEGVIRRAVQRDELAEGIDIRLLIDMLISPFLYRLLVDNSKARPGDIRPIIDAVLRAFAPARRETGDEGV
jgi:AcrR family transcriptional regulator